MASSRTFTPFPIAHSKVCASLSHKSRYLLQHTKSGCVRVATARSSFSKKRLKAKISSLWRSCSSVALSGCTSTCTRCPTPTSGLPSFFVGSLSRNCQVEPCDPLGLCPFDTCVMIPRELRAFGGFLYTT